MTTLAFLAAGYLLGSLSFAVIASRIFGLADPRTYGSGNPGATNVLRSGNKLAALVTLLGDALKGWLAVWLADRFGPQLGAGSFAIAFTGVAAFLGHVFPVFLRFKGGKGVATAAGVLLAFDPWIGLAVLAVWFAVAALFRYSSLAAVVAAACAPFLFLTFHGVDNYFAAALVMSAMLILRHSDNIKRLLAGSERRIGGKKTPQTPGAGVDEV
jgi:acyl phosphate:glycerol-3-phosphate acyltransferase